MKDDCISIADSPNCVQVAALGKFARIRLTLDRKSFIPNPAPPVMQNLVSA